MGYSAFKINGVAIKNPSAFSISRYNVTSLGRLAGAKMVGDFVAKKRKFFFTYDAITGRDLDIILEAIWETEELFYTLDYKENNAPKSAVVYVGEIPTELHSAKTDNWVWKDVTFNLIEQ